MARLALALVPVVLSTANPLEAPRTDVAETRHGVSVPDPYRPLEALEAESTRAWIRAQDDRTRSVLDKRPAFGRFHARLDALTRVATVGVPSAAGGRLFYLAAPAGANRPSAWVKGSAGSPRCLIAADTLPAPLQIVGLWPSPDGRRLAYGVGNPASSWYRVRFLDLDGGSGAGEELHGLHAAGGGPAWTADGSLVYYGRFREPAAGAEQDGIIGGEQLVAHRLGSPPASGRVLLERPGQPEWRFTPRVSDDGSLLVLTHSTSAGPSSRLLVGSLDDASTGFRDVGGEEGTANAFLMKRGRKLLVRTTSGAPRGRLVEIDLDRPDASAWRTVLPESEDALYFANAVAGRLVAVHVHHARHVVRVFSPEGRFEREVALPDLGTTFSGFVGRFADPHAYYSFNGLAWPGASTVFRLDPRTGASVPFERPRLGFEPAAYVTEQVFYTSRDGTRVPMFVAHRRDLPRDGRRPALLYGYGAFGWAATPWFQPQVLAWMEAGGVYALANVRGGGEYGAAWHEAGTGRNRQNAIDDYVAAAQWLQQSGWTSRGLVAGNGGSASGPLAASAMTQRPELFGAMLIDIPVLDLLRFDRFTGGARWKAEFGSPEDPADFRVLRAISPYHALESAKSYPPTLVTAGERDETAVPSHAYKFVARLQERRKDTAALLQVVWGGGHGFGTTREQRIETWARQLAFLDLALGQSSPTSRMPSR
jgi:prolyl oligopeptidase